MDERFWPSSSNQTTLPSVRILLLLVNNLPVELLPQTDPAADQATRCTVAITRDSGVLIELRDGKVTREKEISQGVYLGYDFLNRPVCVRVTEPGAFSLAKLLKRCAVTIPAEVIANMEFYIET